MRPFLRSFIFLRLESLHSLHLRSELQIGVTPKFFLLHHRVARKTARALLFPCTYAGVDWLAQLKSLSSIRPTPSPLLRSLRRAFPCYTPKVQRRAGHTSARWRFRGCSARA